MITISDLEWEINNEGITYIQSIAIGSIALLFECVYLN